MRKFLATKPLGPVKSIQPVRFDSGANSGANIGTNIGANGTGRAARDHPGWLLLAATAVLILPHIPYGNYAAYPFMILGTWFHEMGHGLTALALGFNFDRLVLLENGSGYAITASPIDSSNFALALVSAGGPLGPAIIGSLLILASQNAKARRVSLVALAAALVLSTLIWVRSWLGWIVLPPIAVLSLLIAWKANEGVSRFVVQFLGINAAMSMFGQWNYLFSTGAVIAGTHQNSDTGAIAEKLLLPHWFWATAIIALGAVMIGASLLKVIRGHSAKALIR